LGVNKEPVDEFESQQLMDGGCIIEASAKMPLHDMLNGFSLEIRTGKGSRVEKDLSNVLRELVAIPHAVMRELVSAKEKALEVEGLKHVINPSYPLGHPVVIGVLCLESELEEPTDGRRPESPQASSEATITSYPAQNRVSVTNQP
jgi:hypothetical protein